MCQNTVKGNMNIDWHSYVEETNPLTTTLETYLNQNERKIYLTMTFRCGTHILEVGFGSALGLIYMAKHGKKVMGLDRERTIIMLAKKRMNMFHVKFPLILADARFLPFKDSSFDAILHEGLLEHFDREDRINLLHEHLRVADYVVVDVPTVKSWLGEKGPYDERLLTETDWLLEWHKHFKILQIWKRTYVSIGAVLTN